MKIPTKPEPYELRPRRFDETSLKTDEIAPGNVIIASDFFRRANPDLPPETQKLPLHTAYWAKVISKESDVHNTTLTKLMLKTADNAVHQQIVHDGYMWFAKTSSITH